MVILYFIDLCLQVRNIWYQTLVSF